MRQVQKQPSGESGGQSRVNYVNEDEQTMQKYERKADKGKTQEQHSKIICRDTGKSPEEGGYGNPRAKRRKKGRDPRTSKTATKGQCQQAKQLTRWLGSKPKSAYSKGDDQSNKTGTVMCAGKLQRSWQETSQISSKFSKQEEKTSKAAANHWAWKLKAEKRRSVGKYGREI